MKFIPLSVYKNLVVPFLVLVVVAGEDFVVVAVVVVKVVVEVAVLEVTGIPVVDEIHYSSKFKFE